MVQFYRINNINWIRADHAYPVNPVNPVKRYSLYLVLQYIPHSDAEAQAITYQDGKKENYYSINNQIRNRHDDS
jgi:hypothetical protein